MRKFNGRYYFIHDKNRAKFMSMVKYPKGLNPFLTQKGADRDEGLTSTCPTAAPAARWASNTSTCAGQAYHRQPPGL